MILKKMHVGEGSMCVRVFDHPPKISSRPSIVRWNNSTGGAFFLHPVAHAQTI